MYIQETGRGGRDGRQCQALLLSRKTRLHVDAEMQAYTDLKSPSCRRDFLFGQYSDYKNNSFSKCLCCDNCQLVCKCCICNFLLKN